jgi:glutamate receptor, ionotropic, invertebrate
MQYLTCDEYDGTNTPDHVVDLKTYFVDVNEPATYAPFEFETKGKVSFNGHSFMKFDMDINAVSILGGASVNTRSLGTWTAGLERTLDIQNDEAMRNLTADVVYRIYTVVVSVEEKVLGN